MSCFLLAAHRGGPDGRAPYGPPRGAAEPETDAAGSCLRGDRGDRWFLGRTKGPPGGRRSESKIATEQKGPFCPGRTMRSRAEGNSVSCKDSRAFPWAAEGFHTDTVGDGVHLRHSQEFVRFGEMLWSFFSVSLTLTTSRHISIRFSPHVCGNETVLVFFFFSTPLFWS